MSVTGATGDIGFMDKVLLDFRCKLKITLFRNQNFCVVNLGIKHLSPAYVDLRINLILPLISCGGRTLIAGSNIDPQI